MGNANISGFCDAESQNLHMTHISLTKEELINNVSQPYLTAGPSLVPSPTVSITQNEYPYNTPWTLFKTNWSLSCFSVFPESRTALNIWHLYGVELNQFKQGLVNYEFFQR